jgi:hypothetical protein
MLQMSAAYACSIHVESEVEQAAGLNSVWQGLVCFHSSPRGLIPKAAGFVFAAFRVLLFWYVYGTLGFPVAAVTICATHSAIYMFRNYDFCRGWW